MKCSNCGADLKDGVMFCRECGAKVEPLQKKYCRECGGELKPGAKFCTECGAKIEMMSIASDEVKNSEEDHNAITEDDQNAPKKRETMSFSSEDIFPEKNAEKETDNEEIAPPRTSKKTQKTTTKSKNASAAGNTHSNTGGTRKTPSKKKPQTKKKSKGSKLVLVAIAAIMLVILIIVIIGQNTSDGGVLRSANSDKPSEPKIAVVDVVNMSYPAAMNVLQSAGFTNIISNVDPNTDEALWVVIEQSVGAGKTIKAGDKIELTCGRRCNLYIDVKSELNIVFATYDISINLDGIEIGTVANGKGFTSLREVVTGEHTLVFCKSGSSSPKVTKKFLVSNDMTYSCDLAHSGSSIEIKNESRTDDIGGASLEVVDVTGMILSEAKSKLQGIGFSNIRGEPYGDIWNTNNWIVMSQGLSAGSVVDKNELFQLDCISLDKYYSSTYVGKNVDEIQKLAAEAGFSIKYESTSYRDLTDRVSSMSQEEKTEWIATEARQYGGGTEKIAAVTISNPNEATQTPASTPTSAISSSSSQEKDEIITIENNPEFADLLSSDYVDTDKQASFVKKHMGDTIEFDCVVGAVLPNPQFDTIYDIMLVPGDSIDTITGAVLFYVEDSGIGTFHWDSKTRPAYLEYGSKLRTRAKIVSGDDPLFIYLRPVKSWGR